MKLISDFLESLNKKSMNMHYEQIKHQIDELHIEIDTLSVKLGELIKKKCEIEAILHRNDIY